MVGKGNLAAFEGKKRSNIFETKEAMPIKPGAGRI